MIERIAVAGKMVGLGILLLVAASGVAQQNFDNVTIKTIKVADGVHMLIGSGGNIGVSAGEDGVFIIDDQFAPLTEKIRDAIAAINPKPIKFVLNTHWHGDHTGGNEKMGKTGAVIVAHNNVRKRMSADHVNEYFKRTIPASPKEALPVVTFNSEVTFHLNDDEIHVFHVDPAHTDGDAIVHFRKANVIHMGDLFFSGMFPFIDISSGGSVNGMVAAADRVLAMANEQTKIIPGHGPLSGVKELNEYRTMLVTVRNRMERMIREGKTLDEIKSSKLSVEYDKDWGNGFIKPDAFADIVYENLRQK